MKAKVIRSICAMNLLIAQVAFAQSEAAAESRFDVLAKSIAPIIALLTPAGSNGNHAIDLQGIVGTTTGLPAELNGAQVHVAYEFPDKLLVQFPTPRGMAIVCRDKQTVWAFPAAQFEPLVDKVGIDISTKPLPPFQLEETKAVLLPALFDVHDAGSVKLNEQTYRVLDVGVVGQKKKRAGWPVRLWIRPEDHTVAQVQLRAKDWDATLEIGKLDLSPSLPSSIWQPTPEQHDQVMAIPGDKIAALLQLALKQNK
jgi:outer membrane lipoprotein-sorting protein